MVQAIILIIARVALEILLVNQARPHMAAHRIAYREISQAKPASLEAFRTYKTYVMHVVLIA
jgi:hypothetical protein